MMERYFRILRDPNPEGAAGGAAAAVEPQSIQEAVIQGFDEQEKAAEAAAGADDAKKASDDAAAKAEAEKKAKEEAPEDPEFELDFEEEEGKGKAKAKLSDLKKLAAWEKQNRAVIAGAFGVRSAAAQNPEFGKLLQTVITKAFDDKGVFNKAESERLLGVLEAKVEVSEEKIEGKIEGTEDDIKEMEEDLEDLDADSPQAKILKRNIAASRNLRAQLQSARAQNQEFQKRLDGLETNFTADKKQKEESTREAGVTRLSGIFDAEIATLTAEDKQDGLKFFDAEDKADFDRAVRAGVAKRAGECKSDDDFRKVTQEVAKAVHQKMQQRQASYINDYLRKKGKTPLDGAKPPQKPEDPNKDPNEGKSIGEILADGVFAEG